MTPRAVRIRRIVLVIVAAAGVLLGGRELYAQIRIRQLERVIRLRPEDAQDQIGSSAGGYEDFVHAQERATCDLLMIEARRVRPRTFARLQEELPLPAPVGSVDLDGDGVPEVLWGETGFLGQGHAVFAGQIGGRLAAIRCGCIWRVEVLAELPVAGTRRRAAVLRASGGNGAGQSFLEVIESGPRSLRRTFRSPGSSDAGITVSDETPGIGFTVDVDREVHYNRVYIPMRYRWDGKRLADVTLKDPQRLLRRYEMYAQLVSAGLGDDDTYSGKYSEAFRKGTRAEREFWEKYIKPRRTARGAAPSSGAH